MQRALNHKGFSLIEIISQCPTHYGRYALRSGDPVTLMEWIDAQTVTRKQAEGMSAEELDGKLILGEFLTIDRPVFRGTTFA
jgi:2-oxoglutarate ferredoxin oxidoreductase subunit beta